MKRFRLPKWVVVLAAALFFLQQSVDWCAPTKELHLAASWLGLNDAGLNLFPFWGFCVRLAGADVVRLGWISVWSAMLVVTCLLSAFGDLLAFVNQRKNEKTAEGGYREYARIEGMTLLLSTAAFVFTPGFLAAATRVSPLMTVLLPPAAAFALAMRAVCGNPRDYLWYGRATGSLVARLKAGLKPLGLAVLLLLASAYEILRGGWMFLSLVFPAAGIYLALGVMPTMIVACGIRRRWFESGWVRRAAFFAWGASVCVLAGVTYASGELDEGRAASRVVARIVANAANRTALVSEGLMDDLFAFMLPQDTRFIQLARNRDPAYGKSLAKWIDGKGEELVFAAELGPKALVEEWAAVDREGFERTVLTPSRYFPTRKSWEEACAELKGVATDDPSSEPLRWLLGACGNHLGNRLLEAGDRQGGWTVFWRIFDKVDRKNYVAVVNLLGMAERGYPADDADLKTVRDRRREIERWLESTDKMSWTVKDGARLRLSPETQEVLEKERRAALREYGATPKAKAVLESAVPLLRDSIRGEAARMTIRKAVDEGWAPADVYACRLAAVDIALQDFANAEKDAFVALLANRHDPVANAIVGFLNRVGGDYKTAERHLRRTTVDGKVTPDAKGDLVRTLIKLGRTEEAEILGK